MQVRASRLDDTHYEAHYRERLATLARFLTAPGGEDAMEALIACVKGTALSAIEARPL